MKRDRPNAGCIFFAIILLLFGLYFGYNLAPGSNVYAQNYVFSVSEDSLVACIMRLKETDSILSPKDDPTGTKPDHKGQFDVWFWVPSENEVAYAVVGKYESGIAVRLISFGPFANQGEWKTINQDFDRKTNLQKKKAFRSEVLDKLKLTYHDDGNSMFIFWK